MIGCGSPILIVSFLPDYKQLTMYVIILSLSLHKFFVKLKNKIN